MILDAFERLVKGGKRFVATGSYAWDFGSVGGFFNSMMKGLHTMLGDVFNFIFGGFKTFYLILAGLGIIYVGTLNKNTNISLIMMGVGLLFIMFPLGIGATSVGCAVDMDRGVIQCGSGEFVWNKLASITHEFRFILDPQQQVPSRLLENVIANHNVCIECRNRAQCGMYAETLKEMEELAWFNGFQIELDVDVEGKRSFMTNNSPMDFGPENSMKFNEIPFSVKINPLKRVWRTEAKDEGNKVWLRASGGYNSTEHCRTMISSGVELLAFSTGIFKSQAYVMLNPSEGIYCDNIFAAAIVKNGVSVHTDEGIWMKSTTTENGGNITFLQMEEFRECLWRKEYTINNAGVPYAKMFMPTSVAGPVSWANSIPGYGVQLAFPWDKVPSMVTRDGCPGTTVTTNSSSCGKRGKSVRSTDERGHIIANWCCRSCQLPIPVLIFKTECWFPMEVRPLSDEKLVLATYVTNSEAPKRSGSFYTAASPAEN